MIPVLHVPDTLQLPQRVDFSLDNNHDHIFAPKDKR